MSKKAKRIDKGIYTPRWAGLQVLSALAQLAFPCVFVSSIVVERPARATEAARRAKRRHGKEQVENLRYTAPPRRGEEQVENLRYMASPRATDRRTMAKKRAIPSRAPKQPVPSFPSDRAVGLAVGLLVFTLPLVLYLRTMCPTIYPGDSAELAAAAWCLGIPHPTGYPLFTVLGHLFQRLGLGSPAFSMNLLTAIFGALAALGAYRLNRELWRTLIGRRRARRPAFRCLAGAAGLLMGASATWWDQSTQTEVYPLFLVFLTFGWAVGLRVVRRPTRRGFWTLALLSGVALLHHLLFIITFPLTGLAKLAFVRRGEAEGKRLSLKARFGALAVAGLLFFLPLCGYLYLPLRARAMPAINWGNPRGLQGILWHLTGKQYAATRILARPTGEKLAAEEIPDHVRNRLHEIAQWAGRQYQPDDPARPYRRPMFVLIASLLALLGLACLWRRSAMAALGLLACALLNLALAILYTIADIDAYQIPLWLLAGSLALAGPVAVIDFFPERHGEPARRERHRRGRAWAAAGVALALAIYGVAGWYNPSRGLNKSKATEPYDYARFVMQTLPRNAVVLTFADYDIFPLWYMQVCERARPDVAVIGSNFILNGWYAATLRATLPPGVRVSVGNEPPSSKERWLTALMGGTIAPILDAKRPVYLTFPEADMTPYYDVNYAFPAPSPVPRFFTPRLTGAIPEQGPPSPLVLFQIADPRGEAATLEQRFHEAFPPDTAQEVRGTRRR